MINTTIGQSFILTSTLVDESNGVVVSGETVYYDIRKQPGDVQLIPEITGTLIESTVEVGIYNKDLNINEPGNFIAYITCSGFLPATEDIFVELEDLSELVKQNRHYNIAVEDVIRDNSSATVDQIIRNVPFGKTDHVITKIKLDQDLDWSGENVVEGIVYAWYHSVNDSNPYRMGEQS